MRLHIRRASIAAVVITIASLGSAFAQSSEAPPNLCAQRAAPFAESVRQPQWNGWGTDADAAPIPERGGRTTPSAARSAVDTQVGVRLSEAPPMAYGQPTVAGKRLFVGSADGTVYALDADTGCLLLDLQGRRSRADGDQRRQGRRRLGVYFGDQQGLRVRR